MSIHLHTFASTTGKANTALGAARKTLRKIQQQTKAAMETTSIAIYYEAPRHCFCTDLRPHLKHSAFYSSACNAHPAAPIPHNKKIITKKKTKTKTIACEQHTATWPWKHAKNFGRVWIPVHSFTSTERSGNSFINWDFPTATGNCWLASWDKDKDSSIPCMATRSTVMEARATSAH